MINALFLPLLSLPLLLTIPLCFLGGLVLGYGYFYALQKTVNLMVDVNHGHPLMGVALTLARFSLMALGLYVAVQMGGFTLLATLAGIVAAKSLMFRRYFIRPLRHPPRHKRHASP